jgi:hypothetical protein
MEDLITAVTKIKPSIFGWEKRRAEAKKAREKEEEKEIEKPPDQASTPPPPQMEHLPTPPVEQVIVPIYTPPPPPPPLIKPTAEDIAIMTIAQLEEACRQFGLKPYGKKNVLQDRLNDFLNEDIGGN